MRAMLATQLRYQAWANSGFFDALETLGAPHEAERDAALRVMNHAYVVGRIFAGHLSGEPHGYADTNTAGTPPLADLRAAVAELDRWYLDHLHGLAPAALSQEIAFRFTDGDEGCMSREEMIAHVVMHGGYHRGEVGRILMQTPAKAPWDTFAVFLHRSEPERRMQGR